MSISKKRWCRQMFSWHQQIIPAKIWWWTDNYKKSVHCQILAGNYILVTTKHLSASTLNFAAAIFIFIFFFKFIFLYFNTFYNYLWIINNFVPRPFINPICLLHINFFSFISSNNLVYIDDSSIFKKVLDFTNFVYLFLYIGICLRVSFFYKLGEISYM